MFSIIIRLIWCHVLHLRHTGYQRLISWVNQNGQNGKMKWDVDRNDSNGLIPIRIIAIACHYSRIRHQQKLCIWSLRCQTQMMTTIEMKAWSWSHDHESMIMKACHCQIRHQQKLCYPLLICQWWWWWFWWWQCKQILSQGGF